MIRFSPGMLCADTLTPMLKANLPASDGLWSEERRFTIAQYN